MSQLLTRDQFREAVFARDEYRCVVCGENYDEDPEMAAHHLIDRKCFPDGGYYRDNGATLCGPCHWEAEHGNLTPPVLRDAARITVVVLPPDWDPNKQYDKWGHDVVVPTWEHD